MKTHRLVVHPNTSQAWEIQLKPGSNSLGRGPANDFTIADPSVSTHHCSILVNDGTASLQDLGSTNGTFINQAPVQLADLEHGQTIRLGSVDLMFHSDAATPAPAAPPARMRPAGLRISGAAPAEPAASPAEQPPGVPPMPPELAEASGARFCKFHPKSSAHYLCNKCNRTFCELCVTIRNSIRTCRTCGVECTPLKVEYAGAAGPQGFFASLPGTFIYPFRGSGIMVLIGSTLLFAVLAIMSAGWLSILMKMAALGYLFSYMQGIIHATAAEERQMPEMPGMDGLFEAFFTLAGTVLMSFGVAIGLAVARFLFDVEAIPTAAIIAAVVFGCLYFPMAFLATAMKDTALAANPLIVIPSILKVPVEYLITVILMTSIFGFQKLGDIVASEAGGMTMTTRSMSVMFLAFGLKVCWSFISVYLLTVNMRILGLLYVSKKDELEWF